MQSLKGLSFTVSEKKPTIFFLSNNEVCNLSPLNACKSKKKKKKSGTGIFITYLMYIKILQSSNLIGSVKTV